MDEEAEKLRDMKMVQLFYWEEDPPNSCSMCTWQLRRSSAAEERVEERQKEEERRLEDRQRQERERINRLTEGEIRDKELDAVRILEVPPELKAPVPFRGWLNVDPLSSDRTEAEKQDSRCEALFKLFKHC